MHQIESCFSEITSGIQSLSRSLEGMRLERARAFARAGRHADAESELKDYSFSDKQLQAAAYLILAKIYAQQGFKDKAAMYWQHILKNDPENRDAIFGLSALNQTSSSHHTLRVIQTGILIIFLSVMGFLGFSVFQSRFNSLENQLHTVSQEISNSNRNQFESLNAAQNNLRDQLVSLDGIVSESFTHMASRLVESDVRTVDLIEGYQTAIQAKIDDISKRELAQNRSTKTSIVSLGTVFQKLFEKLLAEQTAAKSTLTNDLDQLTESIQALIIEIETIRSEVLDSKEVIASVQEQIESIQNRENVEQP